MDKYKWLQIEKGPVCSSRETFITAASIVVLLAVAIGVMGGW